MRRAPEEARQEILDVAAEFLQTRSYRDLKVGELMERTQIGRSAFYAYFKDVSELIDAMILEIEREVLQSIEAWGAESREPGTGVRTVLSATVDLWVRKGPMLSGVFDAAAGDQRVGPALRRVLAHYEEAVAAILRAEQDAGLTRSLNCEEIATALVHGTNAYVKERLGRADRGDPAVVLETLEAMWVHSIYPDRPALRRKR